MRSAKYRYPGAIAAGGLLVLTLLASTARAEITRTGDEPWYQQPAADIERAKALFAQAIDEHQRLLRGDARDLYGQALELWDNPDIRWNLALVLEDLGQYLQAHRQLESAYRWGEALGSERLLEVRDRMTSLETQHLARIEVSCDEGGADITLDGQPWFHGSGHQSMLVGPGEHYVVAHKSKFFLVTRSVSVAAGQVAQLNLPMDEDHLIEIRRWAAWKPWAAVSAGTVVAATGAALEHKALFRRDSAAQSLAHVCSGCPPTKSPRSYDRAISEHRFALIAFTTGGTATVVGLALAWINQVRIHRSEARPLGPIEVGPILSTNQVGISAQEKF